MKLRKHKRLGYIYFIDRTHPMSHKGNGMVYYHRHVMMTHIGRLLTSREVVHHIDGNRSNNKLENLEILTRRSHAHAHMPPREVTCSYCGKTFISANNTTYCNRDCQYIGSRKITLSCDEMTKLVWEAPMTKIGEMLLVSDKAVKKFCIKNNIKTPPTGYWLMSEKNRLLAQMD